GAVTGLTILKNQLKQTAENGIEFSRSFAQLASRADLSASRVKKLRDEVFNLGKAGASLQSLPGAIGEIYGANGGDMNKAMSVMDPIAKTAAMGDKDAESIAKFVTERLKGEGREINKENVTSVLQSLNLAQRGGQFANQGEAMQAFRGADADVKGRAHVSDRELAAMMAAATRVGQDKESSTAAVTALMRASVQEFGGDAKLAGFLGIDSLQSGGKFDPSKLGAAAANMKKSGLSGNQQIEMFQQLGMSEKESQGLLAILKDVGKFQDGMKQVNADQKTLEQSFNESTDNLSDGMERLRNRMTKGIDQIVSPFEGTAKSVMGGHLGDALMGLPSAVGGSAKGMAENPGLVAGGIIASVMAGSLGKKLGLFPGGGLASGVATGKALQGAGVTPVFVVNAREISSSGATDDFLKKTEAMAGGGAGVSKLSKLGMLKYGSVAAGAGMAAGAAAEGIMQPGGIGEAAKAVGLESLGEKLLKLEESFSKWAGEVSGMHSSGVNVKVEVESKDPAFRARPKASDNATNPRGP
ncbi:MAG: hypothetical protein PHS14_21000, partial [Elusimicrobia bacterium]|nr:hypothetical protein [Elusimicrobiota bacterium]